MYAHTWMPARASEAHADQSHSSTHTHTAKLRDLYIVILSLNILDKPVPSLNDRWVISITGTVQLMCSPKYARAISGLVIYMMVRVDDSVCGLNRSTK